MIFDDIYKDVVNSFGSLWNYKVRGQTLEIISPYATTNNKFVSVFLTCRNEEFIVSDAGWLNSEEYDIMMPIEEDAFLKILLYYQNSFNVKKANGNGVDYFYKKTSNEFAVPSLVFDMSNFISSIISISNVEFFEINELESRKRFQRDANNFILSIAPKDNLKINEFLDENKSIKLNAIYTCNNKSNFVLFNYITGTNKNSFNNSIFKTDMIFGMANKSKYQRVIKYKIALINDKADGYFPSKSNHYLSYLKDYTKCEQIPWSLKDSIKAFLN